MPLSIVETIPQCHRVLRIPLKLPFNFPTLHTPIQRNQILHIPPINRPPTTHRHRHSLTHPHSFHSSANPSSSNPRPPLHPQGKPRASQKFSPALHGRALSLSRQPRDPRIISYSSSRRSRNNIRRRTELAAALEMDTPHERARERIPNDETRRAPSAPLPLAAAAGGEEGCPPQELT